MRPKHKNIVFKILQDTSIGFKNFLFENKGIESSFEVSRISFLENSQPSELSFTIRQLIDGHDQFDCYYSKYWPTIRSSSIIPQTGYIDLDKICKHLIGWVEKDIVNYLEDKNEVDLWDEYLKIEKVLPIDEKDYINLESFTLSEKQSLQLSLNELKLLIVKKFELDAVNQKVVEDRLDYLGESLERSINKTDWKGILINTIISISIALSLDTQKGQELYNLFVQIMQIYPSLGR